MPNPTIKHQDDELDDGSGVVTTLNLRESVMETTEAATATGKLVGKKVAFVGKFDYGQLDDMKHVVAEEGGLVVEPLPKAPDYLVAGAGVGGKPPAAVAKIQKKHLQAQVIDSADLYKLVLPTADEFRRLLKSGPYGQEFWFKVHCRLTWSGSTIDLSGSDFRGLDVDGRLFNVCVDDCDFREARLNEMDFGSVKDAKFDCARINGGTFGDASDCSLTNATMDQTNWNDATIRRCDFSQSRLFVVAVHVDANECRFAKADLSGAYVERSQFRRADFRGAKLAWARFDDCDLSEANLSGADLSRATLRNTLLARADLSGVNFREAVLTNADFSGANVDGADFQDAVLTGANLALLEVSKAKNFTPPAVRVAGPKLNELAAVAAGAPAFMTSVEVDIGPGEFAKLELIKNVARSIHYDDAEQNQDRFACPTVERGMLNLADRWPKATLRLDTVEAKGAKTARGKKLVEMAQAAWAEVFGVPADAAALKELADAQRAAALQRRDAFLDRLRSQGPAAWTAIDYCELVRFDLRGVDLSGANLDGLDMHAVEIEEGHFVGSNLAAAKLHGSKLQATDFSKADLRKISLFHCNCENAKFVAADLTDADLVAANLQGADFTDAILTGTKFECAYFNEKTVFPIGFTPPADMIWRGKAPRSGAVAVKPAEAGTLDFDTFLKQLNDKVESARMQKAGSMLKAERFQLFAEVDDDAISGVVKSQSSSDLVYSCRLTSAGAFSCCTQNLRPCGGLRGALCKHLLVLIVGLAKAGRLDSATVDHWIDLSRGHKPAIDEEANSAIFLRYKGAEAGEVDWRPTETIPEDFYAM